METSSPNLSLKKSLLNNMNLGGNKDNENISSNEERNNRSNAKDVNLQNIMTKKYNNELAYTKQKKRILRNKKLSIKEKQSKLRNLSKKTLRRNSFYHKSGYNIIGKSLKRGLNENRLGQKDDITKQINDCKTNILNMKYKLLYGFLDENEIERDFEIEFDQYKKLLKKRQNIDFLLGKKQDETNRERSTQIDKLNVLIEKYSALESQDKEEALRFYIEEIIPEKKILFEINNKNLEVIEDPNNEKIHYLYKK